MADATLQITGLGTEEAPLDYDVPPAQSFTLLAVRAVFDGTGAAGAFLPCVQIFSPSGALMAQSVGSSVAAGADADVTFAPFLRGLGTSTTGGGIQFDTDPQPGTYLVVSTTGANGGAGQGMIFHATGANPLELLSQSLLLYAENQGFALGTIEIVNLGDDRLLIQAAGSGDVTVQADPGGVELRSPLVFVTLPQVGAKLQVYDHLGNVVFEVDEDGTILFPAGLPGAAGASGSLYQVAGVVHISP